MWLKSLLLSQALAFVRINFIYRHLSKKNNLSSCAKVILSFGYTKENKIFNTYLTQIKLNIKSKCLLLCHFALIIPAFLHGKHIGLDIILHGIAGIHIETL